MGSTREVASESTWVYPQPRVRTWQPSRKARKARVVPMTSVLSGIFLLGLWGALGGLCLCLGAPVRPVLLPLLGAIPQIPDWLFSMEVLVCPPPSVEHAWFSQV